MYKPVKRSGRKCQIAEDPLGFDLDHLKLPDWLRRNHTLQLKFKKVMQEECEKARATIILQLS
jgi:hypothetical protein